MPVRVLLSADTSIDPLFNLATEEWLFRTADPKVQTLFLWRNGPTVVIGRNQNPWRECHVQQMQKDDVTLARRHSGGGAVFQDLGNTNFTFVSGTESYSTDVNAQIVCGGIRRCGVAVEPRGRNDLVVSAVPAAQQSAQQLQQQHVHSQPMTVGATITSGGGVGSVGITTTRGVATTAGMHGAFASATPPWSLAVPAAELVGRKISGSAYKISRERAFHHGTILLGVNFGALGKYLNPNKLKLQSKGVASVQARVANLTDIRPDLTHETICAGIRDEFFERYGSTCEVELLNMAELESIPHLRNTWEELQDWTWRFGETPEFSHNLETRFDWGIIDLHLDSHHGIITNVKLFSDCLFPDLIDTMSSALLNSTYDTVGIMQALNGVFDSATETEKPLIADFRDWLLRDM